MNTPAINHWTSEQDARQLEMWSDRHPVASAAVALPAVILYAVFLVLVAVGLAIAAAARWCFASMLPSKSWFTRLVCNHEVTTSTPISYAGERHVACTECGKNWVRKNH